MIGWYFAAFLLGVVTGMAGISLQLHLLRRKFDERRPGYIDLIHAYAQRRRTLEDELDEITGRKPW